MSVENAFGDIKEDTENSSIINFSKIHGGQRSYEKKNNDEHILLEYLLEAELLLDLLLWLRKSIKKMQ